MKQSTVTVHTTMDEKTFSAFNSFNTFRLHQKWLAMLFFPLVLLVIGALCLLGNHLLSAILWPLIGLLIPCIYLLVYQITLSRQLSVLQLKTPRAAYSVTMSKTGVEISGRREAASFQWDQLYRVFLRKECAYIYVSPKQAFILPYRDIAEGDSESLLELLQPCVPPGRLVNKLPRRKKPQKTS